MAEKYKGFPADMKPKMKNSHESCGMTHVTWAKGIPVIQGFISASPYWISEKKLKTNILRTTKLSEEFPGIFRQFCAKLSDNFVFWPIKNLEKISKNLWNLLFWISDTYGEINVCFFLSRGVVKRFWIKFHLCKIIHFSIHLIFKKYENHLG